MPDTMTVTRQATISAPAEQLYELVAKLPNWEQWSPWNDLDPNMDRSYTGTPGTVGSGNSWSGNKKAGAGSMTITKLDEPSRIEIDLRFLKPFKSQNLTTFTFEPVDGGTIVTWSMQVPMTFMMKIFNKFKPMDTLIGADFEKGLGNLANAVA